MAGHLGGQDDIHPAVPDLLDKIIGTGKIRPRVKGLSLFIPFRKDQYPDRLTEAMRKHNTPAYHLVRVFGIDP